MGIAVIDGASREFTAAIESLRRRGLRPTKLSSADLEQLAASFKRSAFFSAKVFDAQILERAKGLIDRALSPERQGAQGPGEYMNESKFRTEMREFLEAIDYAPDEGKEGGLQDLTSDLRLNVIFNTNLQMQQGYGQFVQANDADVLDAYPCQELFRLEYRENRRPWTEMWVRAGGRLFDGRMIARTDDPIWTLSIEEGGFNRFGNPFPPFDWGSGMWTRSVARSEAIALGVITGADQVQPTRIDVATGLRAGLIGVSSELQSALVNALGGKARIEASILRAD